MNSAMSILDLLKSFQPAFTALIAVVGILTLWNTTRLWRVINRPVVIAFVDVNDESEGLTVYDLIVKNIGNLTVTDIQLKAKTKDILSCVSEEYRKLLDSECFDKTFWEGILDCFSKDSCISILTSQEVTKNAFGSTSGNPNSNLWIYKSTFPIRIFYRDLSGKRYETKLNLVIQQRDMFANLQWKED